VGAGPRPSPTEGGFFWFSRRFLAHCFGGLRGEKTRAKTGSKKGDPVFGTENSGKNPRSKKSGFLPKINTLGDFAKRGGGPRVEKGGSKVPPT